MKKREKNVFDFFLPVFCLFLKNWAKAENDTITYKSRVEWAMSNVKMGNIDFAWLDSVHLKYEMR